MAEEGQMTAAEMLQQVNEAITKVLIGGQSYQIGSRKLTRADLSNAPHDEKRTAGRGECRRKQQPPGQYLCRIFRWEVRMNWLDSAISFISPKLGAKRAAWRNYADEIRSYDAAITAG